ncbi:Tat pathway signal protein [Anabaena sphaerica FACHB-251]|uniref:Tat pathway signal protein n=1 Tax=Anabaena sphaerica FACHB-251 TaxID=2692883 RepID=A0A927A3W9_9NOST|nr:Tat pathway signal protein [Anabaena sphaerica]MBD2296933.1 Tat pathway signal protein [Anabaena sphaerica FACHB-251]
MNISRRKFTRIALIGSTSLAATSGIFFPKPAEAFFLGFLLRALTSRVIFGSMVRFVGGRLLQGILGPSQEELLKIQLAEKDFIERQFTRNRTELAQVQTNIFWGQERQETWGPNAGFAFVQKSQDIISTAKITGPTMAGIYGAAKILANQGFSPQEIAASLLPVRSQVDDWCSWEGDTFSGGRRNSTVCLTSYRTALGEVTSRYEVVQPGIGGYGNIHYILEAGGQPRRDIMVKVTFS